jgi:hypothetical protein
MITGDHLLIAVETAKLLNLGDRVLGSKTVVPIIRTADGEWSLGTEQSMKYRISGNQIKATRTID